MSKLHEKKKDHEVEWKMINEWKQYHEPKEENQTESKDKESRDIVTEKQKETAKTETQKK